MAPGIGGRMAVHEENASSPLDIVHHPEFPITRQQFEVARECRDGFRHWIEHGGMVVPEVVCIRPRAASELVVVDAPQLVLVHCQWYVPF